MKEVNVIIGILFIILGAILFSMNWNSIIKFFGLTLLCTGVSIYVVAIDTMEKKKKKEIQKKYIFQQILPSK
jgi:surface polysaccharide O-acyltransferase-like enzyme